LKLAYYDDLIPAVISGGDAAAQHLNQATPHLLMSDTIANFGPLSEVACAD